MDIVEQLAQKIKRAQSITCLTGAGVSTASGIPDFRSTSGFWSMDHSREYYMSREYFFRNPEDFWKKYKEIFRLKLLKNYQPNNVHLFLRSLEDEGKDIHIVTQNVDGLHSSAGSSNVIEYHGNLNTAACPACGTVYQLDYVMSSDIPYCNEEGCGDILKPAIVLFGDPITKHDMAEDAIDQSNLVLVLGTSLLVSPFNLLPQYAASKQIPSAVINRESTPMDDMFDYIVHDELVSVIQKIQKYMDE